ncbi:helix-turn-helix transcriptional regulator [uncultured Fretibacterium sp.]|uniref:helix-turn-helix domain-containing protein n=1 Tax=uncultured Fretibacterium sp. TaxID=1678694 RepID=UPI00261F29B8|nr:helix-turn-helix transcriptional regulator [uncultured Fretibacterium sp.]
MKFARSELKKTQKYIAELAGINLRTYINYEQGERETPVSIVVVYSSLGVNPNWLLTGEGEMMRGKGEVESVTTEAVEALSEDRMLEKIVLMLAEMSSEERREVFDHVQKAKHLSDLERRVQELEAERAG